MDYASILRVLVQLDGVAKATAGLTALDAAQRKTAGSASSMGSEVDAAAKKTSTVQTEAAKATTAVRGLGDGLGSTGQRARNAGAGLDRTATAAVGLGQDLRRAQVASQDMSTAIGGLLGDEDDLAGAFMRASGMSEQAIDSTHRLRQARETLAGQAGALLGDEDDLVAAMQRAHQAHQDTTRATEDLDHATRQLQQPITTVTSGFAEASQTLAKAREEMDRTGSVSRSTTTDLNNLGSRGVAGLDRDLERASSTLRKAEAELASTGSLSRRTERDLAALGDAGNGAGGGIGALLGSLAAGGGGLSAFGLTLLVTIPTVVALTGAAIALASALGPLVGLLGAAGVAAAAGGQGFGVFKLATLGVVDALKEQTSNQSQAAAGAVQSAQQQRSAARAIQSAMDGVRTSHEQVRSATLALAHAEDQQVTAQKAVNQARGDARRNLEDLASGLLHARSAEISATYALQDAKTALSQLVNGPDTHKVVEAQQSVTDAIHSQQAAVLALTDAQRSYDDLIRPADAHSLAEAQQAVTDAQTGQESANVNLLRTQNRYNAVLADSTSTELDRREALNSLQSAQNAVSDAANRTIDAQQALDKLNAGPTDQEKAKALLAVQQAQDQVSDATNAQADAQQALDKLNTPASQEDLGKALLAVWTAQVQVADAARDRARAEKDLVTAQKAGVQGSDQVVAALKQVRTANQQVATARIQMRDATIAVARAEQAVSDAQLNAAESATKTATAASKLNQKLDGLPPAAQSFVRQLIALKPRLDDVRQTAAAGLFPGVEAGLAAAMRNFEPVKRVIGETARALGGLTKRAGEMVGSAAWGKDIETVGDRNSKILTTVGDGALHVADALRHVIVAAGPLTSWLARTADGWAKELDASAEAGRESGKLAGFFDRTRHVLELLGSITGHTVSGLLAVGHAGTSTGNDLLRSIDRAAKRFDEWTHSVDGQNSLKDFFQQSRELLKNLIPVLAGVGKATATIGFGPMNTALRLAGPYAEQLTYAFLAYKTAAAVATIVSAGYTTGLFLLRGATYNAATGQWALNAAMDANPIGAVILAIAALAAGIYLAYKKVGWFHDAVDSTFQWIKDHWPLLLGILTGPLGLAVEQIITHWGELTRFFQALPGRIVALLKAAPEMLAAAGRWILDTVVGGFKTLTAPLASVGGWLKNRVIELVHDTADGLTGLGTWVLDKIIGGFKTVTSMLGGAGHWLYTQVRNVVHDTADDLIGLGGWVLAKVIDGIEFVSDKGVSGVSSVGGWILKQLTGLLHDLKKDFGNLGGDIIGWIVDGLRAGAIKVQDFLNDIVHVINKLPGVDIKDINVIKRAQGGPIAQVSGAAVAAGGLVDKPVIMMGEEAPRHPEWVIPTNPAYRSRALDLHAAAGKALGLAQGGVFSSTSYGPPWTGINGTGVTANGTDLRGAPHVLGVAVDPNIIKLGAMLKIQPNPFGTDQPFKAFDTGSAIQGRRIDFYDWRGREAQYGWGTKSVNVDITGGGGGGGGILGAIGGAISGAIGTAGDVAGLIAKGPGALLKLLPSVDSLPDWLKGTGKYVLDKVGDYIRDRIGGLISSSGEPGVGGASRGPNGVGTFRGVPMANWVIEALRYAEGKLGTILHPTSGYRPGFDPHTATGTSEHQGTQYPHGAVDFGGYHDAAAKAIKLAVVGATADFKYPLLAPRGFVDDGHASGTGHAIGGILGKASGMWAGVPFGGSFDQGGIVPGALGQPVGIIAHGGERVIPTGGDGATIGAPIVEQNFHGPVYFHDERDAVVLAREVGWEVAR